jgi:glycosyltransferase involved in cell wall biosynthesis
MFDIILLVTNELSYDQRMSRICTSLALAGYKVLLVGRNTKKSIPLVPQPFQQKRLNLFFSRGKLFYLEFNIRLGVYLALKRFRIVCAIDLDTILPCYFISRMKGTKRVYDAHELFCEMKEVVTRPTIHRAWKKIERFTVPKFPEGYTVSEPIAEEFREMYGVEYSVIMNCPRSTALKIPAKDKKYLLYQGAVNEGRSFETLIPAMKNVDAPLLVCGEGNYLQQAIALVKQYGLEKKIIFKGYVPPNELREITLGAWAGITIFENTGLSNYYSSANRFFDYIHAGIPQLCVDFPVYRKINNKYPVALLVEDLSAENLAMQLNRLLNEADLYFQLQGNCIKAREEFTWEKEEQKLLAFYKELLP